MADEGYEQQSGVCSGNWWEAPQNRFESRSSPSSSSSLTQLNSSMGSFGWPSTSDHQHHQAAGSSRTVDSVSGTSASVVFGDVTQKLQSSAGTLLTDPNLQIMGLGLSSQPLDWNNNQSLLSGGSGGGAILQEEINRPPSGLSFSLEHQAPPPPHRFDSHSSSSGHNMDSPYGNSINININTPANMLQGLLLGYDSVNHHHHHHQHHHHQSGYDHMTGFHHPFPENYGIDSTDQVLPTTLMSSSSKFPQQFLSTTPPKQLQPPHSHHHQVLQFSNNAPYWIAADSGGGGGEASTRQGFFPSPQMKVPMASSFDEKPKSTTTTEKTRDSSNTTVGKKAGSEPGIKRPRSETPASLPAFKVRKEKMGDRITALQQLVSPFGKTDTASVLSEAIEYIKFLHQQVNALSTPYTSSTGNHPIQHQQASSNKSGDPEGPSLRSRGLCLMPISSTFPVAHETTVDFWTPSYGGTFR